MGLENYVRTDDEILNSIFYLKGNQKELVKSLSNKCDELERQKEYNADLVEDLREGMKEAYKIINVLYMDALDNNGESWPRAREWQEKWEIFKS